MKMLSLLVKETPSLDDVNRNPSSLTKTVKQCHTCKKMLPIADVTERVVDFYKEKNRK